MVVDLLTAIGANCADLHQNVRRGAVCPRVGLIGPISKSTKQNREEMSTNRQATTIARFSRFAFLNSSC